LAKQEKRWRVKNQKRPQLFGPLIGNKKSRPLEGRKKKKKGGGEKRGGERKKQRKTGSTLIYSPKNHNQHERTKKAIDDARRTRSKHKSLEKKKRDSLGKHLAPFLPNLGKGRLTPFSGKKEKLEKRNGRTSEKPTSIGKPYPNSDGKEVAQRQRWVKLLGYCSWS